MSISTPLLTNEWEAALASHPDQACTSTSSEACVMASGLASSGMPCYDQQRLTYHLPDCNLKIIANHISVELGKRRLISPLPPAWKSVVHVNYLGLVLKGQNSGKFLMITDLSFPHGSSVNVWISLDLTSLSYITVDNMADIVHELGRVTVSKSGHRSIIPAHTCPPAGSHAPEH